MLAPLLVPPQPTNDIDTKKQRLNNTLRSNARLVRLPASKKPNAIIPAAKGHRALLCCAGCASSAVCTIARTVAVTAADPFTVTVAGFTLQLNWLEDGAQVRFTAPVKPLRDLRFSPTVPNLQIAR